MSASRLAALVAMAITVPVCAQAQELAGSFDQLRVLIKEGERIRVTVATGTDVSGTVVDLGPSILSLQVDGARRNFTESDVTTIRARRSDSLVNGAAWGFGIGAALGALGGAALAGSDGASVALIPIAALIYGGIGVGVGVGIDALIAGEQLIYSKRSARLTLVPHFTLTRKAFFLTAKF
jgi:hypothetical protein